MGRKRAVIGTSVSIVAGTGIMVNLRQVDGTAAVTSDENRPPEIGQDGGVEREALL